MAQVGRISGPLLTANLERNGIDLAFRNNLDTDHSDKLSTLRNSTKRTNSRGRCFSS